MAFHPCVRISCDISPNWFDETAWTRGNSFPLLPRPRCCAHEKKNKERMSRHARPDRQPFTPILVNCLWISWSGTWESYRGQRRERKRQRERRGGRWGWCLHRLLGRSCELIVRDASREKLTAVTFILTKSGAEGDQISAFPSRGYENRHVHSAYLQCNLKINWAKEKEREKNYVESNSLTGLAVVGI